MHVHCMQLYEELMHCTCKSCQEKNILQNPGLYKAPPKRECKEYYGISVWPIRWRNCVGKCLLFPLYLFYADRGCLRNGVANHVPKLSSILRVQKKVLIGCLTIRHFHISLNTLCLSVSCPPTHASSSAYALSTFLSGRLKVSREDEENAHAKLFGCVGGQETLKQSV